MVFPLLAYVNTTPQMPREYGAKHEKMATGKSWMNYYSMTTMIIGYEVKSQKSCISGQHSTIRTPMTTSMLA